MRSLLFAVLLAHGAYADSSVTGTDPKLAPRCSFEDGPHWKRRAAVMNDARQAIMGPYGHFQDGNAKHLLFSGDQRLPHASSVLDAKTWQPLFSANTPAAALAADESGKLFGLVKLARWSSGTTEIALIDHVSGKQRWSVHGLHRGDDAGNALVVGDQLILSTFHHHSTGSRLVSVDLKTGTPRWIAEVEQVNASHSEYFNDVALERRGNTIVMRGYEASGCYVQTFDLETGQRLSSHMRRAW
jgi:outer membrane protein assembly factor BamB